MSSVDPVVYEILSHRLFQIIEEGRTAMRRVSGSEVATECGETFYALYTKEGDTALSASGVLLHVAGTEGFIRKTIEWYDEKPGIFDKDMIFFNDPYIGGVHSCDQILITPIYHKGERIMWIANMTHTPETGAIEPGGISPAASEIFHEGFRLPGLKVVDRGEIRPEVLKLLERATRDPDMLLLDLRAKIAGLNVGKQRILELIEKYGADVVVSSLYKLIDDAEKIARAMLKNLPDGTWRQRIYQEQYEHGKRPLTEPSYFDVLNLAMIKKGDSLTLDFTGTSSQGKHINQCTFTGVLGGIFIAFCESLFSECAWNKGFMKTVKIIAPEGTWVNVKWPAATGNAPGISNFIASACGTLIAKMLYLSDKYRQIGNASWQNLGVFLVHGGVNQWGKQVATMQFDFNAGGTGAGYNRDGVDTGAHALAPAATSADLETYELKYPFLYLFKKQATDSGGPGKFRGGVGVEVAYMSYHAPQGYRWHTAGTGVRSSVAVGVFGGYPAGSNSNCFARNTNILEFLREARPPLTHMDVAKMSGDVVLCSVVPEFEVREGDIISQVTSTAAGWGDPLDRDPNAVLEDVMDMTVSMEAAENFYGVIIDHERLVIDKEATKRKRQEIYERRRKRARPVSEYASTPRG